MKGAEDILRVAAGQGVWVQHCYRHYKNLNKYRVNSLALLEADAQTIMVVYTRIDGDEPEWWVRPLEEFAGTSRVEGRCVRKFQYDG